MLAALINALQADRRRDLADAARADRRRRRGRRRGRADPRSTAGVQRRSSACDSRGALHRGRPDYQDGSMPPRSAGSPSTNPEGARRPAGRRDRRHGPVHRTLGPARDGRVRAGAHERTTRWSSRWPTRTPRSRPRRRPATRGSIATGRSDYPNQINNVLCFPGIFRGALDVRAREITDAMKMAAARGHRRDRARRRSCATTTSSPPSFNRDVAEAVAAAVAQEAQRTGESRVEGGEVGYAPGDTADFRPVKL